ncbi:hypothetical protein FRC12_019743 [Ceratobasidium sp. 428]|nr:hypothetical protein FRC12_019743 [Ceratobasidium sp. 428]
MQTFARLFSIITFLLSLGFVAQALPTVAKGGAPAAREYSSPASYGNSDPSYGTPSYSDVNPSSNKDGAPALDVIALFVDLKTDTDDIFAKMGAASDVAAFQALADALIVKVEACVGLLSVKVNLSTSDKARVVELILNFFVTCIKVCADVSIRLGVAACASVCLKLDICFKLFFLAIDICIDGFLGLFVFACAKLDGSVLAALKIVGFTNCIQLLNLSVVAAALGVAL